MAQKTYETTGMARSIGMGSLIVAAFTFGVGMDFHWALLFLGYVVFREYGRSITLHRAGLPVTTTFIMPKAIGVPPGPLPPRVVPVAALAETAIGAGYALAMYGLSLALHDDRFAGFAAFIIVLNAFDFIPVWPLNGGKIFRAALDSLTPLLGPMYMAVCVGLVGVLAARINAVIFIIVFLMFMVLVSESNRVGLRFHVLHRLARALGCVAEPTAILSARAAREQLLLDAALSYGQLEPIPADAVWSETEKRVKTSGKEHLRAYLEELRDEPPQLFRLAALGYLLAYGLMCAGHYWLYVTFDRAMSLQEFVGVITHHQ